ncbi:hypothetical protein KSC_069760 [Ktedonobacter sp. SOSP1-52]|nr:hypothetical protein KSC_069760 [Ktedonobacter sp. SOSP1-52]
MRAPTRDLNRTIPGGKKQIRHTDSFPKTRSHQEHARPMLRDAFARLVRVKDEEKEGE